MVGALALVCSGWFEARDLVFALRGVREHDLGPGRFIQGKFGSLPVVVTVTGVGKVNAAQALTTLLERVSITGVLGFGVGGAYPGAGIPVAGIAVAESEICADEGVATGAGFRGIASMGLPEDARISAAFPCDEAMTARLTAAIRTGARTVRTGPFLTVSTCTGTDKRAGRLRRRHRAVCENMEGAALAQVASAYKIPFAEVRGISNLVGRRDRTRWRLADGARAASEAVVAFLESISTG